MQVTGNAEKIVESLITHNPVAQSFGLRWTQLLRPQKGFHQYALKSGMSSSSRQPLELRPLRVLNSDHGYEMSSQGCTQIRDHESEKPVISWLIEPLEQRLRILEEEAEVLKGAFLRSMEERTTLMNEIHKQFQALHNHLSNSNQVGRQILFDDVLAIKPPKMKRRAGLLEVLWQEPNPSLVIREARIRVLKHITSLK